MEITALSDDSFSMSAARCLISSLTLQHSWLRCSFLAFSALDISRTFLAHTGVLHIPHSTLTQACYGGDHKGVSCAHDSYLCHSSQPPIPLAIQRRRPTMKTPRARWPQTQKCRPGFPERHSMSFMRLSRYSSSSSDSASCFSLVSPKPKSPRPPNRASSSLRSR